MSTSTTGDIQSTPISAVDWETPVPPTNLIFDDGEPLETNRHRIAMNALIRSMLVAMAVAICLYTTVASRFAIAILEDQISLWF